MQDLPSAVSDGGRWVDAALRGQGVEFHHLLDRLPVGAYVCDPNGLITYYNRRAVELWGRAPKLNDPEDRYCGSFRLYYADDGSPLPLDQCWMALALREEAGYNDREIIVERPDGERRTVLANANPIWSDSGVLLGAINVFIDITDRKRAEEEQRQLRAALAKQGHVNFAGEMAAGIAHELNQPLTAIVNYSEACVSLLRSGTANTDALIAAVEQIAEQGQRAAEIIRRLRALMRKAPLQQETVDLHTLIRKALGHIATATDTCQERVRLRVEVAESLPKVKVDPIQIQQVLVNLIRNSLDAMSDPGVDHRELTMRAEPAADDKVTVTVRDTGCGFAEGVHELLFYPFFTTKPEGMGLGLPISASIIEAHGGRLWATADPGVSTSFHFTVPCAELHDPDGSGAG
ncbi:MAG: PAS domain S-box protein [Nitrococcus mobilis]|nr:PAS domain S-box protein [Nitrococcus mobilis]